MLWVEVALPPQGVNFKIVTYGHMSGVTRFFVICGCLSIYVVSCDVCVDVDLLVECRGCSAAVIE